MTATSPFLLGNEWLKFDFHLHTISDKSYQYTGLNFEADFINALDNNEIKIAAITNHNLFNYDEYLELRKQAGQKKIWLLPGLELSLADGKYGLHLLIIFTDVEIEDNDFVNDFITIAFAGKERFDQNGYPVPCSSNLLQIIDKLKEFKRNFITIAAHVDNDKGFFKTFSNSRINELIDKGIFRSELVAFQDINASSKQKIENLLIQKSGKAKFRTHLPAYVSFSDAKKIEDIGKKFTFIRIGDYDFNALKFSFLNHEFRIRKYFQEKEYPIIESLRIERGNFLEDIEISFNSNLNNLIGVRGTGKSAIIELLRWTLGFPPCEKSDEDYKEKLVKHALGNGGKVTVKIRGNTGYAYYIKKIIGDAYEKVYDDNQKLTSLKAIGDIFDISYFGQKDLSKIAEDHNRLSLIDNYIKKDLINNEKEEKKLLQEIKNLLDQLKDAEKHDIDIESLKLILAEKNEQLRIFKEKKIDELLKEQTEFEKDEINIAQCFDYLEEVKHHLNNINGIINENFDTIKSTEFKKVEKNVKFKFENLRIELVISIKKMIDAIDQTKNEIDQYLDPFNKQYEKIKEDLMEIKSQFDEKKLDIDFYLKTEREIERLKIKIETLNKLSKKRDEINKKIRELIDNLNKIRYKRFELREAKAKEIENKIPFLKLSIAYRGNQKSFFNFLDNITKGLRIQKTKLKKIVEQFNNGFEFFIALEKRDNAIIDIFTETEIINLNERIKDYLFSFLTFQAEDELIIKYKSNDLFKNIEELSIGQRAAALLSIILVEGNKPIIIDQPEDDIDNNTIYEGIIRTLLQSKNKRQFIFATHNSNIVVLGDSDNVIVCYSEKEKFSYKNGSIDKKSIQSEIIKIMEGGEEAFSKRKIIYKLWS